MRHNLDIVFFGTYDLTKPRQRILMENARESGFKCKEIHLNIWGLRDKSEHSLVLLLLISLAGVLASVSLIFRYFFSAKHKYVMIGYPGLLDIFIIYPLAKLKRSIIVFDSFLPLYEILVEDRKFIKETSLAATLICYLERLAHSLADLIITDTQAHADYISDFYRIKTDKIKPVFVGAEKAGNPAQFSIL